jgi:putative transposase
MPYNPEIHHRHSIRLQGYDYSASGAYFITICTYQRQCLFGDVVNGMMELNSFGRLAQSCWQRSPHHFPQVDLDAFVIMPNHVHGILRLGCTIGRGEAFGRETSDDCKDCLPNASPLQPMPKGTKSGSIAAIVQNFKSVSTRRINQSQQNTGTTIWQRNYYEHIIRDETTFQAIRQYIQNNPQDWIEDQLHPENPSKW